MKVKYIFFIFILLYIQTGAIAAQRPAGVGIVYETTLEGYSGGSAINSSANIVMRSIVGGFNTPAIMISSESYGLKLGIGEALYQSLGTRLISISPKMGQNISEVHINRIIGTNFVSGIKLSLAYPGESDIQAYNVNIVGIGELNCDFNITGAKPGMWSLVASSENGSIDILANAFEIKTFSVGPGVIINSPNPFDPEKESTIIYYTLASDSDVDVYVFDVSANLIWKASFVAGINGGRAGENKLLWNGITSFGNMLSTGVYFVHVMDKKSGKTLAKGKIAVIRK